MTTTSAFTTALVTGATSGIGAATAIRLAREGLRVGVAGRDRQRGEAVVERIRSAGGGAEFLRLDLTAGSAVLLQFVDEAEDRIGPVDVLVNNAAAYPVPATDRLTDEQAATILATNVLGPHHLVAALAPRMGGRGAGAIVNVTSWMGRIGTPSGALYSASKAALEQLTRSWAAEYGPRGVRVNAVAPGVTLTDGNRRHLEVLQGIADGTPARALVRPDDIAAAIAYLASDDAARVHGTTITVDGGITTSRG